LRLLLQISLNFKANGKMAPGKGFEPLRAKGPLAGLSLAQALFVPVMGSRGQRDNHSATPA
jgi:hypothetical protein